MRRLIMMTLLVIFSFSLSACASLKRFFHRPPPHIISKTYSLKQIQTISIDGAKVVFVNGNRKNAVTIKAYNNNFPHVSAQYKKHSIIIKNDAPTAVITINKSQWNHLEINDAQKVTVLTPNHIAADSLAVQNSQTVTLRASRTIRLNTLRFTHAGNVTIHGPVRTHTLIVNGNTNFDPNRLHFDVLFQGNGVQVQYPRLNRQKLELNAAGHSVIRLRGYINTLKINLYQHAQLIAPKLVVKNAFIKAHDDSFVRISVRHKLFMYTTNQSVIQYYGTPKVYRRVLNGSAGIPMSLRGLLAP